MKKINKIQLDVDCVLADCVGGVLEAFNISKTVYENHKKKNSPGRYGLYEDLCEIQEGFSWKWDIGTDTELFYHRNINRVEFWSGLKMFWWSQSLITHLFGIFDPVDGIELLTHVAGDHNTCALGKMLWYTNVKELVGEFEKIKKINTTSECKSKFVIDESTLLIDDNEKNIEAFRAKGGKGILFPCLHNSLHQFADTPIQGMAKGIYDLLKELN